MRQSVHIMSLAVGLWMSSGATAFSPISCSLPLGKSILIGEQAIQKLSVISAKRMQLEGYDLREFGRGRRFPLWASRRYQIEFVEQLAGTFLIEALDHVAGAPVAAFLLAVAAQQGDGIDGTLGVYSSPHVVDEEVPTVLYPVKCKIGVKDFKLSVHER